MKKLLLIGFLITGFSIALPVSAHRSGCHRWHTCPSDTGSYTMEYFPSGKPKQFCGSKMYMGDDGHCHYYSTVIVPKKAIAEPTLTPEQQRLIKFGEEAEKVLKPKPPEKKKKWWEKLFGL